MTLRYGIESRTGIPKSVSTFESSLQAAINDELHEEGKSETESNTAPGEPKNNLLKVAARRKCDRRTLDDTDIGHFGRIQSFINAGLFQTCLEILIVVFLDFTGSLQLLDGGGGLRELLGTFLQVLQNGL